MKFESKNIKHIRHILPVHETGERLWENIEASLNKKAALNNLPVHSVSESIWEPITQSLSLQQKRKARKRYLTIAGSISSIAASLLIIFLINATNSNKTRVTYVTHTEETIEITPATQQTAASQNASNFNTICSLKPTICESTEFTKLHNRWNEMKEELNRLRQLSTHSNNEKITFYITRIEKDIQQLENRMMHMFL